MESRVLDVRTEDRFPTDEGVDRAWMDLVAADPAASIFHTSHFLRRWCRHLRGRCDLRLRLVHRDGELIGVVPEVRENEGGPTGPRTVAHFAGGHHVTDYLGPVSRPDDRADVVDAWFGALENERDWDELNAGGLPEDAGWHELIAERARAGGLEVTGPKQEGVCPVVDTSDGWDAYLERITGKQRHEIRRKARKLVREADSVQLVDVERADMHDELDRFIGMARGGDGEKASFFESEAMRSFFHSLVAEFGGDRTFRLHRLDVDGSPAAYTVSLCHDGRWGLYNSAFDREIGNLSPGMVLVGEVLRLAAQEGFDVLDLLRGDEDYKYRFGAVDRPVQRLKVLGADA